ncbi:MAG: hypothetical protein ACRC6M_04695 [Microcystaceae cyanobacterium]
MEITFNNQKLKSICEQPILAQKKLGKVGAKKLQSRLADIIAAETVRDLVTGVLILSKEIVQENFQLS